MLDTEVASFIQQAYVASTKSAYATHRKSYLSFCRILGYSPVPATSETPSRYARIKQYMNIIRVWHAEWNLPNPMENNCQLQCLMRGIRRTHGNSTCHNAPLTPALLLKILTQLDLAKQADCAFWAALLLMFYRMMRIGGTLCKANTCDHQCHSVARDVLFTRQAINVKVRASKSIQFGNRGWDLPIARAIPSHALYPVQAILLYIQCTSRLEVNGRLFVVSDSYISQPLTAAQFSKRLQFLLSTLDVDASGYGSHICHRGGASWAYRLAMPVDSICLICDWRTNAYQQYIAAEEPLIARALKIMVNGAAVPHLGFFTYHYLPFLLPTLGIGVNH